MLAIFLFLMSRMDNVLLICDRVKDLPPVMYEVVQQGVASGYFTISTVLSNALSTLQSTDILSYSIKKDEENLGITAFIYSKYYGNV